MQVWLAFTMQALVDPSLRELRDTAHTELRRLCRRAVEQRGAERLHAFVDGLALRELLDAQLAAGGPPSPARPSGR